MANFAHHSSPILLSQAPAMKTTLLLLTAAVSLVLAQPIKRVAPTEEVDAMNKRDIADAKGDVMKRSVLDTIKAIEHNKGLVGDVVRTVTGG